MHGTPETFESSGSRITADGRGRGGPLWRRTIAKWTNLALQAINRALQRHLGADERETALWPGPVRNGWSNHYAEPTSYPHLRCFRHHLQRLWLCIPRRRS